MFGISMQLDILGKPTTQVTTIICHHMKKILLKKEKRKKNTKIWGLKFTSYYDIRVIFTMI